MKTIWIIDHYSSEPVYGGISRQYDFARELGRKGFRVVVIASGFCHFTHNYITVGKRTVRVSRLSGNVYYVYLKISGYELNHSVGRARSMIDFMQKVLKYESVIAEKYGKPDVVTGCSVHPLAWVSAYKISRKYKIHFIAEVRDFWPRIWVASGERKAYDPMVLFFKAIQSWAFKRADRIIYSMYHGDKYLCGELGIDASKVCLIGQPMDCRRFDENACNISLLTEEIRNFTGIGRFDETYNDKPFICTFTGYYMVYEGVYVMLEAQKILERKGLPVKMVFAGSGQEKEGMMKYVQKNGLHNVLISDRISKEAVPALISHSDICMAHLEVKGHPEVYKYGVSKNKINEYLYSGACTLYGFLDKDDEVAASGGGMIFEPYNALDLAARIEEIYNKPYSERKKYGENGRSYIYSNRRVEVLAERMTEVLFG